MIKAVSILFAFFVFVGISFAVVFSGKIVVTGDSMEIRQGGDGMISKGNSKAINNENVITADKMTYRKKNSILFASGSVKLLSKTQDNEIIKAHGEFAQYRINAESGKLWGNNTAIEYFMQSSSSPLILSAKEIYINKKLGTLKAYNGVEVVTSSGVIFSDNAVFDKETLGLVFKKDKKRPVANIFYDERKGFYEADEMIFYNSDNTKKIIMKGSVAGKIEMKDKIQ